MSLYVNSSGSWVEVPEQPEKAWCNSGGVWTEVLEIWTAEETTPGVYQWVRAWRVPQPPVGVTVFLEQMQIQGGDVEATWSNTTTEYAINIEWEINSTFHSEDTVSAGSTSALLEESELSNGDDVRARMRYFEGSVAGDWGPWAELDPPYVA